MEEKLKNDIIYMIEEIRVLEKGWLWGDGNKISGTLLDFVKDFSLALVDRINLKQIYIYPSEDGGVSCEWDIPGDIINLTSNVLTTLRKCSVELLFAPDGKTVEYSIFDPDDMFNDCYKRLSVDESLIDKTEKLFNDCISKYNTTLR